MSFGALSSAVPPPKSPNHVLRPCRRSGAKTAKKSPKKSSRAFQPGVSKSPEKVKKSPKSFVKLSFQGLFELFGTFLRLWGGRPGKTSWILWGVCLSPTPFRNLRYVGDANLSDPTQEIALTGIMSHAVFQEKRWFRRGLQTIP